MSSNVWAKVWIEVIDDPKMAKLPDWCFRRFIYFLLLAKEYDKDGLLPPVTDIAWRLRLTEKQVSEALTALSEIGVVCEDAGNYTLTNFAKRQAVSDSTERVRKHRMKRDVTLQESISSSSSLSDSKNTIPKEVLEPIIHAIADVTGKDLKLNYGRIAKEAKELHCAGYTAEQINNIYRRGGKWYTVDWRGKRGQLPAIGNIKESIKQLLNGNKPADNKPKRTDEEVWADYQKYLAEEEKQKNEHTVAA